MGRIEFEVSRQPGRFLDPTRGFEPVEKGTETRRDPRSLRNRFEDPEKGGGPQ